MEVGGASFESVAPQRIEIENNYAARDNVQPRRTDTENNNAATRCTKIGKKVPPYFEKKKDSESVSDDPSKGFKWSGGCSSRKKIIRAILPEWLNRAAGLFKVVVDWVSALELRWWIEWVDCSTFAYFSQILGIFDPLIASR